MSSMYVRAPWADQHLPIRIILRQLLTYQNLVAGMCLMAGVASPCILPVDTPASVGASAEV